MQKKPNWKGNPPLRINKPIRRDHYPQPHVILQLD
jgi:hypothetical protein